MQLHRRQMLQVCGAGLGVSALSRLAGGSNIAAAKEVPWLDDIQRPPENIPDDVPKLTPLLVDGDGLPIRDLAAWKTHRAALQQDWRQWLGPLPARRAQPIDIEVLETDSLRGVQRQLIRYRTEPGTQVEAYLLRPEQRKKTAGVVVFHSTVDHSLRQPAGVEGAAEKAFGLKLAERGIVSLCPRNFLWPENHRIEAAEQARQFLARQPQCKGMARMLLDAQMAVDLISSLPEVDPQRIGAVGHSLGAKEVLYLAAFDERVKVSVSSEGGVGIGYSNWEAPWYLGPEVQQPGFAREHHQLLGLAAPRPFLLIGGDSADGARSWPFIEAALPVYRLYREPARLGLFNHGQGHSVPEIAERRIYQWFETYL